MSNQVLAEAGPWRIDLFVMIERARQAIELYRTAPDPVAATNAIAEELK